MEHRLTDATGVRETHDWTEADKLLNEGWTLHSIWPDQNKTRYVLLKF
ncbi:hypothetical protein J2Z22_001637 [Paenibacillus forsythiae]|uniref:DUF4177 domain-containing protein n=1 Tax=Paenibacillus forsythiae TaxID=365616 RepID=A0ABU3H5M6_9BACL|nr:hypothetical protein [Paenibacillus forsythiae]MDT3426117.1 hypothetical protein [Paenibacillus forsythiae]